MIPHKDWPKMTPPKMITFGHCGWGGLPNAPKVCHISVHPISCGILIIWQLWKKLRLEIAGGYNNHMVFP
jgi:hypothetical protein